MTTLSFEFFAPKSVTARDSFFETSGNLALFNPSFVSITHDAMGNGKESFETAEALQENMNVPVAAHLTFIGKTKDALKGQADYLWNKGITRLVALRGDTPDGYVWPDTSDTQYFRYTSEFVEALKGWHDFDISVGTYPDKHPESATLTADIDILIQKCELGASRAITQFFFDNDVFYRFVDAVVNQGLNAPIIPGVLPIYGYDALCAFAKKCHMNVPDWIHQKFDGVEEGSEDMRKIARDILYTQVTDLIAQDVPHLHFYTLNKSDMLTDICKSAGFSFL
jgi:methylenetetrahydrofolate reductase (NADPH)